MNTIFRTAIKFIEVMTSFFDTVLYTFTTPMNEVATNALDAEWIQDSPTLRTMVRWMIDARFSDDTLLEWMLTSGIIVVVIVGVVKFFLPTS